jgi:hypothetical protein
MEERTVHLFLKILLKKSKRHLFIILPIFFLLIFSIVRLGNRKECVEGEYVTAVSMFEKWNFILDKKQEGLEALQKAIKKHPELGSLYDQRIAQNLLIAKAPERAKVFLERGIKRFSQPYYSEYAETSMHITEGNYQQALSEAIRLKEQMLSDESFWDKGRQTKSFGSTLFTFNLLRIAILCQTLENKSEERAAWKELKRFSDSEEPYDKIPSQEGYKAVFSHFIVREMTLSDYIAVREKELNN